VTLSDLDTASEWHTLIPGGHGEGPGVLAAVEDNLFAVGVPGVMWTRESISTGIVASLLGRRRDFLVVTFDAFPEHRVLLGCRDYGNALGVSLFVVATPRLCRKLCRALLFHHDTARREEVGSELSPIELADLTAAIAVVRHALNDALQNLSGATKPPWDSFSDDGTGAERDREE